MQEPGLRDFKVDDEFWEEVEKYVEWLESDAPPQEEFWENGEHYISLEKIWEHIQ